ncbi:MAG: ORC1-type DNA replication protein [Candidatus Kariarchaeaceae archaeon]
MGENVDDTTIENIFDRYISKRGLIFENREVLRHTYVPDRLPHREKQYEALASILAPTLVGESPSNAFEYGQTGTGKTAVTKAVLNILQNKCQEVNSSLRTCYLNCQIVDTTYRVFANLNESIGLQVPVTGLPTETVYSRFVEALDALDCIFIVVLDEIDMLLRKSWDALYNLTRINSDLSKSKLSIIGITNNVKFKESLDPRVRSSLGEEEIVFSPYLAPQLKDILEDRCIIGFKPGVVDPSAIHIAAAFAAQEHGDARRALDLIRVAGEVAERKGVSKVTDEQVRQARQIIERNTVAEVITTLPIQTKVVLTSIFEQISHEKSHNTTTGELYDLYSEISKELMIDQLTQRRISDLINELEMLGIINCRVVSKGRYGRTKEISLSVPLREIRDVLSNDYRISEIIDRKRR